jgi:hypothetical protein
LTGADDVVPHHEPLAASEVGAAFDGVDAAGHRSEFEHHICAAGLDGAEAKGAAGVAQVCPSDYLFSVGVAVAVAVE